MLTLLAFFAGSATTVVKHFVWWLIGLVIRSCKKPPTHFPNPKEERTYRPPLVEPDTHPLDGPYNHPPILLIILIWFVRESKKRFLKENSSWRRIKNLFTSFIFIYFSALNFIYATGMYPTASVSRLITFIHPSLSTC